MQKLDMLAAKINQIYHTKFARIMGDFVKNEFLRSTQNKSNYDTDLY